MDKLNGAVERINSTIQAVCPFLNISVGAFGDSTSISFIPDPSATPDQITAAQNAINNFDWSDAAQQAWDTAQTLQQAVADVSSLQAELTATRAIALVLGLRFNELYAAYNADLQARGLPPITPGQIQNCPQTPFTKAQGEADTAMIIDSGLVDS